MNGWLVLSIHNLDDIPVRMFPTREEAVALATTMLPAEENPLVAWDQSGAIGAKVLQFVDGLPQGPAEFFPFGDDDGDPANKPVPAMTA